jgi:Ca2+-binding RTX toxin-like protein
LRGTVAFGIGNDTFDNRGGSLNKLGVIGGAGDDTLIVDDSKHFLKEDAMGGTDTVKSTVSYTLSANVEDLFLLGKANIDGTGTADANEIHGNSGNNKLTGLAGADDLFGGKGKDMLIGGADSDTFHFGTGDGADTVKDFTQMEDTIDVSKWTGMSSLAAIKSHAADGADGVVITMGNDSLTLIGIHKAELADGDFHFAM